MARVSEEIRLLELQRALFAKTAKEYFPVFLNYMDRGYDQQWFHKLVAQKCQELYEGVLETSGLMLFVPPQHGKLLPADTPVLTTKGGRNTENFAPEITCSVRMGTRKR